VQRRGTRDGRQDTALQEIGRGSLILMVGCELARKGAPRARIMNWLLYVRRTTSTIALFYATTSIVIKSGKTSMSHVGFHTLPDYVMG